MELWFWFKNLGLVDAIKTYDSTKIEQAVFRNIEKLTSKAMYSVTDKVANALSYGVKVGGRPVGADYYRNDNSRDGIAAGVEAEIIGITEEEAASVLAACAIWKDHDDLLSIIIYSIISTIILTS
ncbi:hypothetical protein RhiirA5_420442 [Rhizophagus irregularis]|uniref:Uncharacterized protein n=1 Tax=Rhizophagus irregularis TaxID=588596 RepID=A0A2N0PG49_9GLOM|nr:hypothetical protein RhiirA5_420442 [Rhizophagus irregularis]